MAGSEDGEQKTLKVSGSNNEGPSIPLPTKPMTYSKPPPESPGSAQLRRWVVMSFWAVVVLLGLPVWWWTTSIYRASLPLDDMLLWADGKVFPVSAAKERAAQ